MNREHEHEREDLFVLGTASVDTKGGPYGIEDHWGTLMVAEAGLTQD
jgi:hypothetical protein